MDTSRIYSQTKFANFFTKPPQTSYVTNTTYKPIEKIDADDLIKDFKILNIDNFVSYLKDIWKVMIQT